MWIADLYVTYGGQAHLYGTSSAIYIGKDGVIESVTKYCIVSESATSIVVDFILPKSKDCEEGFQSVLDNGGHYSSYRYETYYNMNPNAKVYHKDRGNTTAVETAYTISENKISRDERIYRPSIARITIDKTKHGNKSGVYIIDLYEDWLSRRLAPYSVIGHGTSFKESLTIDYEQSTTSPSGSIPSISYTGTMASTDSTDATGNLTRTYYLTTSGILTVSRNASAIVTVVGGGGGGGAGRVTDDSFYSGREARIALKGTGAGGGSGDVVSKRIEIAAGRYGVAVGAGGAATKVTCSYYSLQAGWQYGEDSMEYLQYGAGKNGGATAFGTLFAGGGMGGMSAGRNPAYGGFGRKRGTHGAVGTAAGTRAGGVAGIYGSYGNGGYGAANTTAELANAPQNGTQGIVILKFTIPSYTVKYNINGGSGGSMADSKHVTGEASALRANAFTKTGKVNYNLGTGGGTLAATNTNFPFAGWSETATGAVAYSNGQSVTNLSTTNNATVNLYAKYGNATAITLPAPTNSNYDFLGWYKDAAFTQFAGNGGSGYTASTTADTLYAKWKLKTRTLTVTETEHGTVNPMSIQAEHGSSATFTVTPEYGYEIDRIVINGVTNPSYITDLQAGTYTIPELTADGTIQVYYKLKTYTLTVTYDEGISISPGTITVQHGSTVTFNIAAIHGYEIEDVLFNGASQGALTEYTTPQLVGDSTLHVDGKATYDFQIVDIVPGTVRVGTRMFFSVKFSNTGMAHAAVPIDIDINGLILHATSSVPENGDAYCFFDWTPTIAGEYDVTVTANPERSIVESNYTNNTFTDTITVLPAYEISDPDPTDLSAVTLTAPPVPAGSNNTETTWDENGITYWARLNFTASITEPNMEPMHSGYGFSVNATTAVTHNYYNADRVQDPEGIIMLLPEYDYDKGVSLEKQADGTWQLPVNTESPTNARRWYIPTGFGDGQEYVVLFQAYGAFTPGGELTAANTDLKQINGSMYDDDITAPRP